MSVVPRSLDWEVSMNVTMQLVPANTDAVFAEEIETWLAIRPTVMPELPIVWTLHNRLSCAAHATHPLHRIVVEW